MKYELIVEALLGALALSLGMLSMLYIIWLSGYQIKRRETRK